MNGQAIAAQPLGHAGPRVFVTEIEGPRPGGVRSEETARGRGENRSVPATRP